MVQGQPGQKSKQDPISTSKLAIEESQSEASPRQKLKTLSEK
jgi:hypothetical protein